MNKSKWFSPGIIIALSMLVWVGALPGEDLLITREQALAGVFPGAEIRHEMVFLSEAQMQEARDMSGVEIESPLIALYTAVKDGSSLGRGYVDTHTVRTETESLLIILDTKGRVQRIEVTASSEPPEHRATPDWLRQYKDRTLDDDLNIDRAIRPIAGATLTAIAANQAVRRVLAIDYVLQKK